MATSRTKKVVPVVLDTPKVEVPKDCMPRCKHCAFVDLEPKDDLGLCRRYPPLVISMSDDTGDEAASVLPVVDPDKDWCGEFIRRTN